MRIEHDGVEPIAAWLDADALDHRVAADQFERQAIDESFRHRLDGERVIGVAGRDQLAVDGGARDAEAVRIDCRKLGDIVGERARPVG